MVMTRKEIKEYLFNLYPIEKMGRSWRKVECNNELKKSVEENTNYLNGKLSEKIYHIIYNLYEIPKCKICNENEVNFNSFKNGYSNYCSFKCAGKDEKLNKKIKQKNLDTYSKNKSEIRNKIKQTNLEKYGVEDPNQLNEIKNKIKQTNMRKYGVEYTHQNKQILEKVKKSNLEKYGVEWSFQSKEIKNKIKQKNIEKYGTSNIREVKEINDKIKKTTLERYGTDNIFKNKDKVRKSILEKYGVLNVSELSSIVEKRDKTRLKNFIPILKKNAKKLNLDLLSSYKKDRVISKWKCTNCNNIFEKEWFHLNQGFLCPFCYPRNPGTSIIEKEVSNFIKSLGINNIIENSRDIIKPKEIDIYLSDYDLAIELNGLYWHSDKVNTEPFYHLNKSNLCKEKNIRLIHIFEDEWIFKQDIVKEKLKFILNLNIDKEKIYARNCNIKEIDSKTKNKFLEKFHLQGKDSSVIKLGAFYNNKLVSAMTFSYGNISKGSKKQNNIWELNRFCSDYNYHIPGVASKLLTYFKRNYEWKEIFSYADKRWSDGNLYYKLGFEHQYDTKPNYWYVSGFKRIHRFNLRKNKNDPKDIPEWVLRESEGYFRIWDCGNMKFLL